MGWAALHFWEKEVLKNPDSCMETVLEAIRG